ncbi:aminoglycoside phosphotransferase family protein [Paraliomyxa miuraensis]|uniref:aminoglycoside phosphotransferase family protein n=1 Tax=Paraliomyxa miuraensis TaxID=376150 RepID=UPI0022536792|nr:aminoglycoside phosphotransferase family protein [Paraliomyxa miuraensis]MCX4241460.1 aminoglycoside phosphotransferase family protein [Paraliomyxa miuraensis]
MLSSDANEHERWRRFVRERLGDPIRFEPVGTEHGEARVWRATLADHRTAYLKVHRVPDKWRRERALLQRLAEPPAAPVPAVLAHDAEGLALLLEARPGVQASTHAWTAEQRIALHEQAGRFRRRLDAVPLDGEDDLPLPDAMDRRLRAWIERARTGLDAPLLRAVQAAFDSRCFEHADRRWCHRDFGPYNWIVDPSGPHLSVIDFGQARPDAWLMDVIKLWDEPWVHDPALADAFWRGYGRKPASIERQQLRQLALLHGLATATWGDRHHHAHFSRHGRAVLARALASAEPLP